VTTPPPAPVPLATSLPFRQMLDEAVKQTRRHFRRIYPFVAIPVALLSGLLPLAQGLFFRDAFPGVSPGKTPDMARMMVAFGAFAAVMVAFMVVSGLGYGAMFTAATDALAGREISMRRAWGTMLRPRVFGTLLLMTLVILVGFLFCVLPGFYLGLIWAFAVPVMVVESRFGMGALSRSAELARYNPNRQFDADPRLHVFITVMVGTLLGYTINLLVQLPFMVFQQFVLMRDVAGGQKPDPAQMMARLTWFQVPTQILGMLTNTAVYLYICFGLALLFFDLKQRQEGLDVEAAVAGLVQRHRARRPA